MHSGNLRDDLPPPGGPEAVSVLARAGATRVERIVSYGHASPPGFWYDQEEHEYVLVVSGRAELELEHQGVVALGPGDWVDIPARVRHRVAWTAPNEATIWLAVFYQGDRESPR